jgi:hypothetical protein
MTSPYLMRQERDLPDMAEIYRREIALSEGIILTLEASLAAEQRRLAMYERKLDTIQTQISDQLRQAGIRWVSP